MSACALFTPAPTVAESVMPVTVESTGQSQGSHQAKPVVVSRRMKNPVNIPESSRRFRPLQSDTNSFIDCFCVYWQGTLRLAFSLHQGEATVIIKRPGTAKDLLYRYNSRQIKLFNIGDTPGDYKVIARTSIGMEYEFEFTIERDLPDMSPQNNHGND